MISAAAFFTLYVIISIRSRSRYKAAAISRILGLTAAAGSVILTAERGKIAAPCLKSETLSEIILIKKEEGLLWTAATDDYGAWRQAYREHHTAASEYKSLYIAITIAQNVRRQSPISRLLRAVVFFHARFDGKSNDYEGGHAYG